MASKVEMDARDILRLNKRITLDMNENWKNKLEPELGIKVKNVDFFSVSPNQP